MCGIAGIIQNNSSQYNIEHLKKMTDALSHRGPDGEGHWQNDEGTVLLGHRRLSIIDLSDAGQQPMIYMGRYIITHNGEIYNYIELREALQKKGYTFHSKTDTEVIAAAYDCWKEDCLSHFDGMFAFAVWDKKENELFAARDRFGEKPFFFFYDNNSFVFASEMKAAWAAGIERRPNLKLLFNFITIGYTSNPEKAQETFFENIHKLPPASWLKFSFIYFNYSIHSYWDINQEYEDKKITDNEAIEKFSSLFKTSVQRRLRSDVATGTSLSGGLDSSSIAAFIQEVKPEGQHYACFTASFPENENNDLFHAKKVAEYFGLQQHIADCTANDLINSWEKLCYHQEEPFGSASTFAQYKVYETARQHHIKVLLDGQGADETLAGYHKYYKWYWQELFRKRKLKKSKEIFWAREIGVNENFDYRNMIAAYFPAFASIVMERQYLLKALKQEDLTREFVQQQSKDAYYTPPEHFDLNGVLYFNTITHGLEELLRLADRNAMAHGCEIRLPFLSHELVEFVFSLPSHFKIRKGWSKWLLRETVKEKLPHSTAWRRDKVGFEPPQKKWMEHTALQEAIFAAKKKLVAEKVLKPEVLNKKIIPAAAFDADNYDWRYFSAANLFR
jgi:asparagine synthase (glutamine-hydrolysing)